MVFLVVRLTALKKTKSTERKDINIQIYVYKYEQQQDFFQHKAFKVCAHTHTTTFNSINRITTAPCVHEHLINH